MAPSPFSRHAGSRRRNRRRRYGWPEDIATDDALARLLALNLERSAQA
jgi:hypothetical protein